MKNFNWSNIISVILGVVCIILIYLHYSNKEEKVTIHSIPFKKINSPNVYEAYIRSVYDGDTYTADIHLGRNHWIHDQKLRLLYVDTPEMRSSGYVCGNRVTGKAARDSVRNLI